jgi:hypothetical protein
LCTYDCRCHKEEREQTGSGKGTEDHEGSKAVNAFTVASLFIAGGSFGDSLRN